MVLNTTDGRASEIRSGDVTIDPTPRVVGVNDVIVGTPAAAGMKRAVLGCPAAGDSTVIGPSAAARGHGRVTRVVRDEDSPVEDAPLKPDVRCIPVKPRPVMVTRSDRPARSG